MFAFTTAAIEVDALKTVALVFALTEVVPAAIVVPSDVDAVKIAEFVFEFTVEEIPEVCVLVFAFTTAATEVDAERTVAFMLDVLPVTSL